MLIRILAIYGIWHMRCECTVSAVVPCRSTHSMLTVGGNVMRTEHATTSAAGSAISPTVQTAAIPRLWDGEADVVVIGAGATGLPAAIVAREAGASVILVEAEKDIGGHAITSGGNVALGGGSKAQKKYGIEDSHGMVFRDLPDVSEVHVHSFTEYSTMTQSDLR